MQFHFSGESINVILYTLTHKFHTSLFILFMAVKVFKTSLTQQVIYSHLQVQGGQIPRRGNAF